jgi:glycosyltransferase involved in cell wall biosynthesis
MPVNILQLVSSSRTSGAERHVVVLSDRLRLRGHHVVAVCPPGDWLPEQLRAIEVPAYEMEMRGMRAYNVLWNLHRFVREHKIDLIHAHLTRATYFGLLTGRMAQVPLVSSVHCRTHDVAYRFLFPPHRSRIITVSDYLRDGLLRKGVPPSRIQTIYNGTDFCFEEPGSSTIPGTTGKGPAEALPVHAELSLPPDAELIGLFARVEEFKGHYILAQAARRIVAARPRAYFVCVGPVDPQIQRDLWEIAASDGVADRLRFTGVRDDIPRLMSAMDVVTLPSRYEACSMAIIEAMALGKPVVATRAGGNPELVKDQETGLLIERNADALAQALISILSNAGCRHQMGLAARQRAEAQFSARVMVDQIEHVYGEMLAGRSLA